MKLKDVHKTPTYFGTLQLTQEERNSVLLGMKKTIKAIEEKEVRIDDNEKEALEELFGLINKMKKMAGD